ncbi:unnamed protein product [Mytilus coruscus]|uniref:Uncharacterized protein n=1 Tax=Mytilus coruscus TaxID=42192 RepID=A0A6J8DFL4_MYTCO|nr:unnamed protein product [Mytilus coruscus]
MYGAEFDSNLFASKSNDEDVPCALCRTNRATSVIMIPGHYNHVAAPAYVCIDKHPEYIIGGVDERTGKLFDEVLTKCGSLKCPPYIDNYPMTCVASRWCGYYGESGSAAEYVSLPPDPNYIKTSGSEVGHMYGGEFDNNFFATNSDNEDVPCALCRTTQHTSVIMIPGKKTCYCGWKIEYHGYLASGGYSQASVSSFVCVNLNPEYIIGAARVNHSATTHFNSSTTDVDSTTKHINPTTADIHPTTADIHPTTADINITADSITSATADDNSTPTDFNPTSKYINPTAADINPTTGTDNSTVAKLI